jgi:excisionase family DNA binding protein
MKRKALITPTEAAKILGVSRQHVHRLIGDGRIKVVETIGPQNTRLLNKAQVTRFQKERKKGKK